MTAQQRNRHLHAALSHAARVGCLTIYPAKFTSQNEIDRWSSVLGQAVEDRLLTAARWGFVAWRFYLTSEGRETERQARLAREGRKGMEATCGH